MADEVALQVAVQVVAGLAEVGRVDAQEIDVRQFPLIQKVDERLVEPLAGRNKPPNAISRVRQHEQHAAVLLFGELIDEVDDSPRGIQGQRGAFVVVEIALRHARDARLAHGRASSHESQAILTAHHLQGRLELTQPIQRLGRWTRVGTLDENAALPIDLHVRHRRIGRLAIDTKPRPLPAVQIAIVIIVENVENNALGRQALFLAPHPQICLIDRVAADAEVADRFSQVRGQHLLPRLAVADLLATCEAVAVGVDAARAVGVRRHATRPEAS